MARTVEEIKTQMEERWMQNDSLRTLYGWQLDSSGAAAQFGSYFSKVSIENLILYIVAYCAYVVETLHDAAIAELESIISSKEPGRPQWYIKKLKEFIYMPALPNDLADEVTFDDNTGEYIISDTVSDTDLNKARIVKHAVAIDTNDSSQLILKVAGENSNCALVPLSQAEQTALGNYIGRIKYAGVRTVLINKSGDLYSCNLKVWYDPLYSANDVKAACESAIKNYLRSLPFNGEYSNMALVDALQKVNGVKVAELMGASYVNAGTGQTESIDAKVRPYSGYFNSDALNIEMICYE